MQHRKANICFIAVLLHLLLLRSFDFVGEFERVLYIFFYISAYYIPIFIMSRATKKANAHEALELCDIKVMLLFFEVMTVLSMFFTALFNADPSIPELSLYTFLLSGFLAPIFEELLWRHGVYRILSCYGFIPAAFISSLLFALMHSTTAGLCYAFFSGVMLCLLYERTKSPILPIALHIFNNCLSLIASSFPNVLSVTVLSVWGVILVLGFFAKGSKRLELSGIKLGVFKNYYLYLTLLAFIVLRFTEA